MEITSLLSPSYLKDYYKGWTDDCLFDRHRELLFFEDENNFERKMIEAESNRRETEANDQPSGAMVRERSS